MEAEGLRIVALVVGLFVLTYLATITMWQADAHSRGDDEDFCEEEYIKGINKYSRGEVLVPLLLLPLFGYALALWNVLLLAPVLAMAAERIVSRTLLYRKLDKDDMRIEMLLALARLAIYGLLFALSCYYIILIGRGLATEAMMDTLYGPEDGREDISGL